ncbi:MAG: type II toxin-antitoxin system RelE/ParE family toxin [Candidatus Omnitrophica bacterium]|nr:type II toxin-antitoxin system RelE/ParE family toxin [Candidatus Omnitrophota bacterium]
MGKIRWTSESEFWLGEIYSYISEDNPRAAYEVVLGIYEKVELLEDFPGIGYSYRMDSDGEIRILLYGHYRIAYLLKEDGNIDILGVFHGAMDMDKHLP